MVLDYKLNDIEDNVFSIIIFMFIESGFILEEFVVSVMDIKDFVFFKLDLDENWLSGYFWNLIGSDLLWKMQCLEVGIEDSGYVEEESLCGVGN